MKRFLIIVIMVVVVITATACNYTSPGAQRYHTPTLPTGQPPAAVQPTQSAPAPGYPLAGQVYFSNRNPQGNKNPSLDPYYAIWDNNGWLHQPNLPPEGKRVGFVISVTIEEGVYAFNGVSCRLHLDTTRNGTGANNPQTVGYGNNLQFRVDTADNGQAWGFVVCDPTDVTGFSIQYKGP